MRIGRKFFVLFMLLGFAAKSLGCSVPVFRYALERWECDEYRLIVAVKGELPPEHQTWVEELKNQSYREDGFCNLMVHVVDITDEANQGLLETYPVVEQITEPTAVLLYPRGAYLQTIVFQEPFSDQTVQKLTTSAFVETVTLDILAGTSAVWVLVDSGNQAADDAAYDVLIRSLAKQSEQIEIEAGVIETSGNITGGMSEEEVMANYDPSNFLRSGIPLKVEFSVKRLSRTQAEPVFRGILMNIVEGLEHYSDQPMVFPVFGRGRFLHPLVGEGIEPGNIEMASAYICGACSCQVKLGNPGVDLLSHMDWYSYLEGSEVVHDRALPPLTGTGDLAEPETSVSEPVAKEIVETRKASPLARNLVVVVGVVLGVVVGVSFSMRKKK